MLQIKQLTASVDQQPILHGIDLQVQAGEVHAIMGPNGSGKSTFANVLAGREGYEVEGQAEFEGQSLLGLLPEERAALGLFLGFQYPVEIPGVNNAYFLKAAVNALRVQRGESPWDAMDFLVQAKQALARLKMDESFLHRSLNVGFSGGEKKRNEIFQMLLLQPKLAILDETDSGLDIDALKIVSAGVNHLRDASRAVVLVTHYQRLLNYIQPDVVHVLVKGKIVESGGPDLAMSLEKTGYSAYSDTEESVA